MKNITLFAITLSFSSLMFSCKKCQECKTDTKQTVDGYTQTTSSNKEYCGDEYNNAPSTGTYSNTTGSIHQEVTITCSDK